MPVVCRAAVLVLAAFVAPAAALGAEVPPSPAGRVTDLAGLLSPDQRRALEERLAAFERETTHQVAVLTIPSLEGEPLEPFSHRVATTWKLGRAGVDNGVLLLIAARDRKVRIEVGYGLEPSLPDGLAGAIIRESIAPRFRQSDFAGGINAALDRIFAATRGADLSAVAVRRAMEARRSFGSRLALYALVAFGLFGLAHFAAQRFMGKWFWSLFGLSGAGLAGGAALWQAVPWGYVAAWAGLGLSLTVLQHLVEEFHRCPRCAGWLSRRVIPAPAGKSGYESVLTECLSCRFRSHSLRWVRERAPDEGSSGFWLGSGGWSAGGGGGGAGGGDAGFSGGGGDFGGGGASGDW